MNKPTKYTLYILDLFQYSDKAIKGKSFDNATDAINEAKRIILDSIETKDEEGYDKWFRFGTDVVINSANEYENIDFNGQKFVKDICGVTKKENEKLSLKEWASKAADEFVRSLNIQTRDSRKK